MVTTADSLMTLMPQRSLLPMALLTMTVAVVVAVDEEGAAGEDAEEDVGVDAVRLEQEALVLLPPRLLVLLPLLVPPRRRTIPTCRSLVEAVVVDATEAKAILVLLRRKSQRRRRLMSLKLLTRPRNSTRTARSFVATSETVANATSVTSATSLMRLVRPLAIPSLAVVDAEVVRLAAVPNPKLRACASPSVTTSRVSTGTNASSSMGRTTSARSFNLELNARLLGLAINSATTENVSSVTNVASPTTRMLMEVTPQRMMAMPRMRQMRNKRHK